jgi:hypothetical protein
MHVSREAWLTAIQQIPDRGFEHQSPHELQGALTVLELAELLQMGERTVYRLVKKLVIAGKAHRVTKIVTTVNGAPRPVSAYRLLPFEETACTSCPSPE